MDTVILILVILALIGFAFDGLLALLTMAIAGIIAALSAFDAGRHWLSDLWERIRKWWFGSADQWEL